MKTLSNFVMTLTAVVLLAACGNTQKPTDTVAAKEVQTAPAEASGTSISLKDDKLNAVYPHYIHLTKALVDGDMAEAKVAVNAIELGAKELENGTTLTTLAAKIGAATDIEVQRTLFSDLSNDFIARVKNTGLDSGNIYVSYCPMALNDKGALWLSNEKDIKNPYFGASMLTCGEVKETLN